MISKIWANALVIVVATALSLTFVVEGIMNVPVSGSKPVFFVGAGLYLFFGYVAGHFPGYSGAIHATIWAFGHPSFRGDGVTLRRE